MIEVEALDTYGYTNSKNNVNPGQINVSAHTNGLCVSVPITQYIMSGLNKKIVSHI